MIQGKGNKGGVAEDFIASIDLCPMPTSATADFTIGFTGYHEQRVRRLV
jgi:hypothetical protein